MIGITFEELYDYLSSNHEIEFSYHGVLYSIEPASDDGIRFVIWRCDDHAEIICSSKESQEKTVNDAIENLLSQKCFDGESFLDIEDDVIVDTVF